MKVDGGCLCGHITYEAMVDETRVLICHCTDCQTHSGTAYGVVVGITDQQFTLLSGALMTFVKTAASGNKRAMAFCPECGTRIHASPADGGDGFFGLRVGTVHQRDQLKPTAQVWTQSAQDWVQDLSDIEHA